MIRICFINGPNLNLTGSREPDIYGSKTLDDINAGIAARAAQLGYDADFLQSNHEGVIIDYIQKNRECGGMVINAGAFSHYSYAIRDALSSVSVPKVEVHLSNIYAREEFRRKSVISEVCSGSVCGLGGFGYIAALEYIAAFTKKARH